MKIAWVSQCFPPVSGAVAERVHALAGRFARAGHDVVVATGSSDRHGVLRREWQGGVAVVRSVVAPAAALAGEVRACDVIIAVASSRRWALWGWALAELLRVPFVLELHGVRTIPGPVRRRADLLVVASADRSDEMDAIAIPHGIDVRACVPSPRDTALRADLGIGDELVVVGLGTHANDRLQRAAQRLSDVRFVLLGAGAGPSNVTVVPAPRPERRARLVAAADVVVATDDDPLSQILEAMACARPVLLVGRGEAAGIVEAAGAGWVVARDDTDALADAIRDARADPAGAWARGEVARLHVAEHFDADRLADAYLAQLHRITGQ
jgi:glycosyltransferase involved in cell wall biosynthesis